MAKPGFFDDFDRSRQTTAVHADLVWEVKSLYDRIKTIDSTIPVLMVHGPLVLDKPEFASQEQRIDYLDKVVTYSEFADVVGFDVYPVTTDVAKVGSPQSQGNIVGYDEAIPGYINWLRENIPGKKHLMVYQGFSYVDMFESDYLNTLISADQRQAIRAPSGTEIKSMIATAISSDVSLVIFWGQGMLRTLDQEPWPNIVETVRAMKK